MLASSTLQIRQVDDESPYTLIQGDCIEQMSLLPDKSVQMVLTDLPYGMTRNRWDTPIDLIDMWEQFSRVCTGAIVLHGMQPFSSTLVQSNLRAFRYSLTWVKSQGVGHLNANREPLRKHEDILVFYSEHRTYNPQKSSGHKPYKVHRQANSRRSDNYGVQNEAANTSYSDGTRYPTTVLQCKSDRGQHPTQKPVALAEYLIRTYTNPGDTVLDCCMGSGTTGVAAINTGRRFVGIEQDKGYYDIAQQRLSGKPPLIQ